MLRPALFLALLALPFQAMGQEPTKELYTLSDVAVLASAGGKTAHDAVAAKTQILGSTPYGWSPLSIKAYLSDSATYYQSHSTTAYPSSSAVGCLVMERGYCRGKATEFGGTSAALNPAGAILGPHSFLLVIKGKAGTKGTLSVSWHSKADPVASATGHVDIGNDSSIEYAGLSNTAERKEFPVTLGANPLEVKIQTHTSLTGTGVYADWVDLFIDCSVYFTEDKSTTCTLTPYGAGCGPQLAGGSVAVGNNHVISLMLTGGYANGFALSFVGTQALNLPIGGGCSLLSNAVVVSVLKTDAKGECLETWKVPLTKLATAYHQMLPIGIKGNDLVFSASNGMKLECK